MRGSSSPSPGVRLLVVSISLLLAPLVAGCTETDDGSAPTPQASLDPELLRFYQGLSTDPEMRLETDHGTIRLLLYQSLLPRTAGHIASLADDGFYDDTLVHRVVDDFVIQGGDPSDTGQFGSGETVPLERDPRLRFAEGAVGLARDLDPDSGDSQWFVTERPAPHLDDPRGATGDVFGAYSLFGQVFEGMPVVRSIAAVPVVPGADRPIEDVVVHEASLLPPPDDVDLLGLVRTLDEDPQGRAMLSRPLDLFAGHTFTVYVYPGDEETTWNEPTVHYGVGGQQLAVVPLSPLDDDPGVWHARVTLPDLPVGAVDGIETPATLRQAVHVDGRIVLEKDVSGHGWHEELEPLRGRS